MLPSRTFLTLGALALLLGAGLAAAVSPPPSALVGRDDGPRPVPLQSSSNNTTQPPPTNHTNRSLPAPTVTPATQYVTQPFGVPALYELTVRNPAPRTQTIRIVVAPPITWTAGVYDHDRTLSPGETIDVRGWVHSSLPLPARGNLTVQVFGEDAHSVAFVDVCFSSFLHRCPAATNGTRPPGGNQTQPGGNGTQPGGNHTQPGGNQTQPGGNQTQPGGNATQSSGGFSFPAAASGPVLAAEAGVSVEGSAQARLDLELRARGFRTALTGQGSVPEF